MPQSVRAALLLLLSSCVPAHAQLFLADGSMKLRAVAADQQYGHAADNAHAIKVGSPDNAIYYMMALRGPQGEKVVFSRVGSCCPYPLPSGPNGIGLLARWQATYAGLAAPITLYLNKNEYADPQCPAGFTFQTEASAQPPATLPADSIRQVQLCTKYLFAVDDALLKAQANTSLPLPDKTPAFAGGPDALKQYFAGHPLTDAEAKNVVFRVIIGFQVSCTGKAGNFRLLSQGRGALATYANQVLAIANHLPQQWQPALKDGQPIDCYQTLSFTVLAGSLERVAYR